MAERSEQEHGTSHACFILIYNALEITHLYHSQVVCDILTLTGMLCQFGIGCQGRGSRLFPSGANYQGSIKALYHGNSVVLLLHIVFVTLCALKIQVNCKSSCKSKEQELHAF